MKLLVALVADPVPVVDATDGVDGWPVAPVRGPDEIDDGGDGRELVDVPLACGRVDTRDLRGPEVESRRPAAHERVDRGGACGGVVRTFHVIDNDRVAHHP